jgi:orotidine-5'-phosphate decarboxylase
MPPVPVEAGLGRGLIAALDTSDPAMAAAWAAAVSPHCAMLKVGLQLFCAAGPDVVRRFGPGDVFLDLKLHDIPNTVRGAIRSLIPVGPSLLTLHASGGAAMVAAARDAVEEAGSGIRLLAVTVLTSFDADTLGSVGVSGPVGEQVVRLARLAVSAGAHGLVCSAHEIAALRDALGEAPILVVPGIRPAGSALGDQARVMTPRAAMQAGADYIVVGRPITRAEDPGAAAAAIAAEIA